MLIYIEAFNVRAKFNLEAKKCFNNIHVRDWLYFLVKTTFYEPYIEMNIIIYSEAEIEKWKLFFIEVLKEHGSQKMYEKNALTIEKLKGYAKFLKKHIQSLPPPIVELTTGTNCNKVTKQSLQKDGVSIGDNNPLNKKIVQKKPKRSRSTNSSVSRQSKRGRNFVKNKQFQLNEKRIRIMKEIMAASEECLFHLTRVTNAKSQDDDDSAVFKVDEQKIEENIKRIKDSISTV